MILLIVKVNGGLSNHAYVYVEKALGVYSYSKAQKYTQEWLHEENVDKVGYVYVMWFLTDENNPSFSQPVFWDKKLFTQPENLEPYGIQPFLAFNENWEQAFDERFLIDSTRLSVLSSASDLVISNEYPEQLFILVLVDTGSLDDLYHQYFLCRNQKDIESIFKSELYKHLPDIIIHSGDDIRQVFETNMNQIDIIEIPIEV